MHTCTKSDGTLVTCSDRCKLPWGCPALSNYDEARALYVERHREAVRNKGNGPCECDMGKAKDCWPGHCVLDWTDDYSADVCCGSCGLPSGHLPCDGR